MRAIPLATLLIAACAAQPPQLPAAGIDYAAASTEQLIDSLQSIDTEAPGIHETLNTDDFVADDAPPVVTSGVLGSVAPVVSPQIHELVRRGADALPALVAHLNDRRRTKLTVGEIPSNRSFFFLSVVFCDEYEAKHEAGRTFCDLENVKTGPHGPYAVRVGDISYALIGQIVNRRLNALRYQPTAILIINSPIEEPSLIRALERDWRDTDAAGLRESLLSDLRGRVEYRFNSALARLRLYYPDAYKNLGGLDMKKRDAFEFEETERHKRSSSPRNTVQASRLSRNIDSCLTLDACLRVLDVNIQNDSESDEEDVNVVAAKLRSFGDVAAKRALLDRVSSPDLNWRIVSPELLETWPELDEQDLPQLLDAFHMQREIMAAPALAKLGSPAAFGALIEHFLERGSSDIVAEAIASAGIKAIPYLRPLLESDDDFQLQDAGKVWIGTVNLIRNMGLGALPAADRWVAVATNPSAPAQQRVGALRGMSGIAPHAGSYRERLLPLLRDPNPVIAQSAELTLAAFAK